MTHSISTARRDVGRAKVLKGAGPFSTFECMVAWRYLWTKRKQASASVIAIISFIGIMLGVATLITVMAVMNGFRTELLTRILGINGHLLVEPFDAPLVEYESIAKGISSIAGIKYAIPLVEGQVLASHSGVSTGAIVRGIRGVDLGRITLVAKNIRDGNIAGFEASEGVIIGTRMAQNLKLQLGDMLTMVFPSSNLVQSQSTLLKVYPVSAIFEVGMSQYDASVIYMPILEAQQSFKVERQAQMIEVFVDNPDAVNSLSKSIEAVVPLRIRLTDWRQRNQTFFAALQVQRNAMLIILTLIVVVAALNIISGLIMLVRDKRREIAVLRTVGASRGSVMRIFMMTGAILGATGTMAGVALGIAICLHIERLRQFLSWVTGTALFNPELYFLSELPARLELSETLSVAMMALILSFLATLYPAWRAASLDPIDALKS